MNPAAPIDRRTFLASVGAAGGSLALGFQIPFGPPALHATSPPREITAWIVIEPDDTVIIRVAKSRDGPGRLHRAADAGRGRARMRLEQGEARIRRAGGEPRAQSAWGDMSTGGSRSICTSQDFLRRAGATAREMLIGAAAARWSVPAAECRAAKSVITHVPSGRSLTFGQVAEAAARIEAPNDIKLKDPDRLEADRNAAAAARGHRQGHGQADLRNRRAPAGMLHAAVLQARCSKAG